MKNLKKDVKSKDIIKINILRFRKNWIKKNTAESQKDIEKNEIWAF